jgi:hypothetical protein
LIDTCKTRNATFSPGKIDTMSYSKHQKHDLMVDVITTDQVQEPPGKKKVKDMTRTMPYYSRTKLKPKGQFEEFYTLKAKCRELEREEEQEIQKIVNVQDKQQEKLERQLQRTVLELNRSFSDDFAKIRRRYGKKNMKNPEANEEVSNLQRRLKKAIRKSHKNHDDKMEKMKAYYGSHINVIKDKRREAMADAWFNFEEFGAHTGIEECVACSMPFYKRILSWYIWDGSEGNLQCPDCPNLRSCYLCSAEYELGDELTCECCSEQGCPSCIVERDDYDSPDTCDLCCGNYTNICLECVDERECIEKTACGVNICGNCIDSRRCRCSKCAIQQDKKETASS